MKKAFSMNARSLIIATMIILIGFLPVPVLSQAPPPEQAPTEQPLPKEEAPTEQPLPKEEAPPAPPAEQAPPAPPPEQAQPAPPPEQAPPALPPEQAIPQQAQPEQSQPQQPEQSSSSEQRDQVPGSPKPSNGGKSGCLIATAAFGSEIAPQVQFLRNFRQNYILSTNAGSSFMNVFNSWYYSFSPT